MSLFSKPRLRNLILNTGLVLVSLFVGLLLSEILLRACGHSPSYGGTRFFQYDPVLGWRLTPNFKGVFERPQFRARVAINSLGVRGPEIPYEKPAGKKRIVVLGDSFTWGFGVNDDEVFSRLIQQNIPRVEVINGGITAYGTTQELLWLEHEGFKFDPDLVVLLLYCNDLLDNVSGFYHGYYRPLMILNNDGSLKLTGIPCPQGSWKDRFRRWVVRHSAILGLTLRANSAFIGRMEAAVFGERTADRSNRNIGRDEPDAEYPVRLTVALVDRIKQTAQSRGAKLLLVTLCHGRAQCQEVVRALSGKGLPLLSIDDTSGYAPHDMHLEEDEHWNAKGHKFAAKAITDFIKKHNLLSSTEANSPF